MTAEVEIPTEYGTAVVWWDGRDPQVEGWVLRYHLEAADSPDALGRRHLDEPLDGDIGVEDIDQAHAAGLATLSGMGIGAGRQCTAAEAAEVAGLASAGSWRSRAGEWGLPPDGHYDGRTPWWWQTRIMAARDARPGQGTRTDLQRKS